MENRSDPKGLERSKVMRARAIGLVLTLSMIAVLVLGTTGTASAAISSVDVSQPTQVRPSIVAPGASVAINGTVTDDIGGSSYDINVQVVIAGGASGAGTYNLVTTLTGSIPDGETVKWQVLYPDDFTDGIIPAPVLVDENVGEVTATDSGSAETDIEIDAIICDADQVWVNPHMGGTGGGFGTTPDACAGCHRAHTAKGDYLLTVNASRTNFCYSCHESGTGAYTDVANGIYLGSWDGGTTNDGLRGGGFEMAKMDTDLVGGPSASPLTATSWHNTSDTGTVWGSNDTLPDGGAGDVRDFECTNCHNPHGNGWYRLLRPRPGITFDPELTTIVPPVEVPNEDGNYTITYDSDGYRQVWSNEIGSDADAGEWDPVGYNESTIMELGEWCTTCHIMYFADENSGTTDSGHDTFHYRHWTIDQPDVYYCENCHAEFFDPDGSATNGHVDAVGPHYSGEGVFSECADCHPTYPYGNDTPYTCLVCHNNDYAPAHIDSCFACHVAHGTSATMGVYSGTVPWPDGTTSPSGNERSSLLWVDNRGVCTQCHNDHLIVN
ncbi:MAG: cytochrome c3 family protein [Chloroflexota bacterium]|nr:cytochrome c3 family protein [Chloroflexota bacterium]